MRQTTGTRKSPGEKIVKDIKRATRKHYSSEEKIRIVLDGLRGKRIKVTHGPRLPLTPPSMLHYCIRKADANSILLGSRSRREDAAPLLFL
jgi:hypothetical protein